MKVKLRYKMEVEKIRVFLSRPNPFLSEHQYFLDKLQQILDEADLKTLTLQADNYDLTDSINYLKGMIRRCYGIIIVGFKQLYIEKGKKKKGGRSNPQFFCPEEIDVSGQALTSPFCHIEGTIGILNDLPLLIVNEAGIREEGIIKGGRFSVKTPSFTLEHIDDFFADKTVRRQISVWVGKVIDYYLFLNIKKI